MGDRIWQRTRCLLGGAILVALVSFSFAAQGVSALMELGPNEQNISARFLQPFSRSADPQHGSVSSTRLHVAGTDEIGRDVFVRLFFAARVSLGVAAVVALSSALLGAIIGGIAGFCGGILDAALMRLADSLLALPQIPIMIILSAVDLKKLPVGSILSSENESVFKLCLIMVLFSWMPGM